MGKSKQLEQIEKDLKETKKERAFDFFEMANWSVLPPTITLAGFVGLDSLINPNYPHGTIASLSIAAAYGIVIGTTGLYTHWREELKDRFYNLKYNNSQVDSLRIQKRTLETAATGAK